jgi:predicted anti-sigma-YlaC factor YlaD
MYALRLMACRLVGSVGVALLLSACSPKSLLVQGVADQLAAQGQAVEDDLVLAREASAFYLKLSESLLAQTPGHLGLAASVTSGFTQYAYAFVAFEAERLESTDARAALKQRERAARLYWRAQRHALAALEQRRPDLRRRLEAGTLSLDADEVALAYWGAAAWGAAISLSKDRPDAVADLPLAVRLARAAWEREPGHGGGSLAALMGSFEAARPGGSRAAAAAYFDAAVAAGAGRNAGALVARAEALAQPAGDRAAFETLLQQALAAADAQRDLGNQVMRGRAMWLLETIDDRF